VGPGGPRRRRDAAVRRRTDQWCPCRASARTPLSGVSGGRTGRSPDGNATDPRQSDGALPARGAMSTGDAPRTVSQAGEAAVLEGLSGAVAPLSADPVGNGDDAAVLGPASATVVTTDMLVEGTHFRLDLTTWRDLGRRAVAQNVSDVLAMGADCSRVLV